MKSLPTILTDLWQIAHRHIHPTYTQTHHEWTWLHALTSVSLSFSLLICPENRIKIELHFSLIAAAVTYIMWKNVGNDKIEKVEGKRFLDDQSDGSGSGGTLDPKKRRSGYWRVDCQSASKGLFLGLLCLVGGIIILIIFFVMKVISIKYEMLLNQKV